MPWRRCCLAWPLGKREHKQLLHQNLRALASLHLQQTINPLPSPYGTSYIVLKEAKQSRQTQGSPTGLQHDANVASRHDRSARLMVLDHWSIPLYLSTPLCYVCLLVSSIISHHRWFAFDGARGVNDLLCTISVNVHAIQSLLLPCCQSLVKLKPMISKLQLVSTQKFVWHVCIVCMLFQGDKAHCPGRPLRINFMSRYICFSQIGPFDVCFEELFSKVQNPGGFFRKIVF